MKSIINALYSGHVFPEEKLTAGDRRYKAHQQKQVAASERLCLSFNEEQRKLFEVYQKCVQESESYLLRKSFRQGFRLGAKILIEVERG